MHWEYTSKPHMEWPFETIKSENLQHARLFATIHEKSQYYLIWCKNPSLSVHSIDSAWNLNRTAHTAAMLLLCICCLFSVFKNHLHLAINRLWDFTNIVVVDSFYQINLSSIRSTINHFRKLIHWLLRFGPTFK